MTDRPNFDELVGGDDLSPEEAARLQRVHDLLIEAGPPPELPPHLLQEPDPEGGRRDNVTGLPRRRTGMLLGIAAALTLTAFLGGFIYGTHHAPFNEDFAVPMHSTAAGSQAKAVIHVGKLDSAGNWPLRSTSRTCPSCRRASTTRCSSAAAPTSAPPRAERSAPRARRTTSG